MRWVCATNGQHQVIEGALSNLAAAVRAGYDLRRSSTYNLPGAGLVEETMTLQTTWIFDTHNVGGLQTLRHPLDCGLGISMQPCMSLWIFGVTASQNSAFVPLDGKPMAEATGNWARVWNDAYSAETGENVPGRYEWFVRGGWEEVLSHDEHGTTTHGSWTALRAAAMKGATFKVGIRNLWAHLGPPSASPPPEHEVFLESTTNFAHLDQDYFAVLTQPTVLLQPGPLPLSFDRGENFELGWLVARTDGKVQMQMLDPSTMRWRRDASTHAHDDAPPWTRCAMRWFVHL